MEFEICLFLGNWNLEFNYMDSQTDAPEHSSMFRLILFLFFIVLAFFLFYFYQTTRQRGGIEQTATVITPTTTLEEVSTNGSISLNIVGDITPVVGKEFEVDVVANSAGKAIVGYDLVFTQDPQAIEIKTATSLLDDFTVYPSAKSDNYVVTATKKIGSNSQSIWDKTPVLRMRLVPKKSGTSTISLLLQQGSEKTQMVDEATQVLMPQVGQLTLEIQQ